MDRSEALETWEKNYALGENHLTLEDLIDFVHENGDLETVLLQGIEDDVEDNGLMKKLPKWLGRRAKMNEKEAAKEAKRLEKEAAKAAKEEAKEAARVAKEAAKKK